MERNRDLFWKLVESEHLKVRAFCRKLIGNREDGDDLYQDALIHALSKFNSLRELDSFCPWLYRIIINKFKNTVRRPWWNRFSPLTREIEDSIKGDDPLGAYSARRRLSYAFKALNPDEQALITLFELQGWSISELANLYGKNESAVKMRLSRARAKIRKKLTKFHPSKKKQVNKIFKTEDEICVATKPGKN